MLSEAIEGAVLKQIAFGGVEKYIKTHEAIKGYDELRRKVLRMAMFTKTEEKVKSQRPVPMGLNAVI